jgi:hypothetical protein
MVERKRTIKGTIAFLEGAYQGRQWLKKHPTWKKAK